jgi:hypothetical protein
MLDIAEENVSLIAEETRRPDLNMPDSTGLSFAMPPSPRKPMSDDGDGDDGGNVGGVVMVGWWG